ncbi:hypothetical protein K438DRAFT_1941614 [Mycena galopus ATCC 62051]|nr:hypothetical protein K438DRAFT_1941614 [Mycena galopus ATCC 62051]
MVDCLCKGVGMDSPKADTDASDDPHFHMLCERRTQSNEDCCWPSRFDIDGSKKFDHLTPQLTKPKWAPRSLETVLKLAASRNGRDEINASAAEEGAPRQLTVVCSSYRVRQGAGNGEGHESRGNAARAQAASRGRARANPGHKKIEIKGKRRALEPVRQWNKKSGKNHSPPARSDGVANKIWLFLPDAVDAAREWPPESGLPPPPGRLYFGCTPTLTSPIGTASATSPASCVGGGVEAAGRCGATNGRGGVELASAWRAVCRSRASKRASSWQVERRAGKRGDSRDAGELVLSVASGAEWRMGWRGRRWRGQRLCLVDLPKTCRMCPQNSALEFERSLPEVGYAQPFHSGPWTLAIIISSTSCTVEDTRGCACTGTTWASPELSSDLSLAPPDISAQRTRATFMPLTGFLSQRHPITAYVQISKPEADTNT